MNDFHRPTHEEFDVLVRDQKLDGLQAHELGLVLYHVDEDLKEYRKRREGRKPTEGIGPASKEIRGFVQRSWVRNRSFAENDG
jgi:hypothetical protein